MKKIFTYAIITALFVLLASFTAHKFYVGIYQINFAPEKKMLQITARVFVDDINDVLKEKHKREFHIGEENETADQVALMQKYFNERFLIKTDGKVQNLQYLSKEMENNVLIVYFRCTGINKINSLEITNKILMDHVTEQQNIIQTNINGKKTSLLLTVDNVSDSVSY